MKEPAALMMVAGNHSPADKAGKSEPLPGVRLMLVSVLVMLLARRETALLLSLIPIIPPNRHRHDSTPQWV